MMSWIWCILFCVGAVVTTVRFGGDAAVSAMLAGAGDSVTLCLSLAGAYLLWMGLLNIAERAGLMKALSRALKKPAQRLFPGAGEATGAITLNLAANMLGLGNAATPFGLEAMRLMQQPNPNKRRATPAMCVFLAINASALQVIPTTMIGLRAASGSLEPGAVLLPTLISSAVSTGVTVVVCLFLVRRA